MLTLSRLSLATLLLALPIIHAQGPPAGGPGGPGPGPGPAGAPGPDNLPTAEDKPGDESVPEYPQWVTNDYPCVIGCCQGFNGDISRERNPELEGSTRKCVVDTCNKQSMAMNLYQMSYIVEMFYETGSIYECDGKPCWPEGGEPAPGQDGTGANGTASASGTGEHSATPAVSIPAVSNASSGSGEPSTTVQSVTASDGSVTVETSVTSPEEQPQGEGENGAARSSYGIGLAVMAVGLAMGAGGVL